MIFGQSIQVVENVMTQCVSDQPTIPLVRTVVKWVQIEHSNKKEAFMLLYNVFWENQVRTLGQRDNCIEM